MKPKEIHRTPLSLKVIWSDGHEEFIDYIWMRSHCTCAVCRERGPLTVTGLTLKKMTEPKRFDLVGNYALGVFWADNHHSIFSFDALYQHQQHEHLPPITAQGLPASLSETSHSNGHSHGECCSHEESAS